MEKVSRVLVMLSSYNGMEYIGEQIESIINQVGVEVSLLIRDDGSRDNTINVIKDLQSKYGNTISYYSGENIGYGKSFQSLLMNASEEYDYYAFADQDDVWKPKKIKMGIDIINDKTEAVLYCSRPIYVDEKLCKLKKVNRSMLDELPSGYACFNDILATGLYGLGCSMLWNNRLQKYLTCLNDKIDIVSHDNFMTLLAGTMGSVYLDNVHSFYYRQHKGNVSGDKRSQNINVKNIDHKNEKSDKYYYIRKVFFNNYNDIIINERKQLLKDSVKYRQHVKSKIRLLFMGFPKRLNLYQKIKFIVLVLSNRY